MKQMGEVKMLFPSLAVFLKLILMCHRFVYHVFSRYRSTLDRPPRFVLSSFVNRDLPPFDAGTKGSCLRVRSLEEHLDQRSLYDQNRRDDPAG